MTGKPASTNPERRSWSRLGAIVFILAAAFGLRLYGSLNDLWLDEIWSLDLVGKISSPWEVFTRLHHENNHYLNSLWIYFAGQRGNWPGYRVPSILAGVGAVLLAGMIGNRRNPASAFFAMLLTGFSYVLVLYSTEARGYSTAIFFAFLAYYVLDRFLEKENWWLPVMFVTGSILGLASQLIFAAFLFSAFTWTACRLFRTRANWRRAATVLLSFYAVPCLFIAWLYFVDIRKMVVGGGFPSASLTHSYGTAMAWSLGTPLANPAMIFSCVIAITLFITTLQMLWRQDSDSVVFFVGVVLVFPIALIAARGSPIVYTRHYIIAIGFLQILFSYALADLYYRGPCARIGCLLLLAGYLVANGFHLVTLFRDGKGNYAEAVRFMAENSKGTVVTVGSDENFRFPFVLHFFARQVMGDKTEKYFPRGEWARPGPEWWVLQMDATEILSPPEPQQTDDSGNQYGFVKAYPAAPLSGISWVIYRNRSL